MNLREIFGMFQGVESNIHVVPLGSQYVVVITMEQKAKIRTLVSKLCQKRRKQREVSSNKFVYAAVLCSMVKIKTTEMKMVLLKTSLIISCVHFGDRECLPQLSIFSKS